MKSALTAILLLLALFSGFMLGRGISRFGFSPAPTETKIIRDTLIKEIPAEPVVIEKIKATKEFVRDTLILTEPFTASADTIIRHDTVRLYYRFPENNFSMSYYPSNDSIYYPVNTIIKTQTKERPWWEVPVFILSGAAAGIMISEFD